VAVELLCTENGTSMLVHALSVAPVRVTVTVTAAVAESVSVPDAVAAMA